MISPSIPADLLLLAVVAVIALHARYLVKARRWFFLDPLNLFWVGILVVYILSCLSFSEIFIAWHDASLYVETWLWILVSCAAVILAYERGPGEALGRALYTPPRELNAKRFLRVCGALIGVGIFGYVYQFASAGGFRQWIASARGGTDWVSVSPYIAQLANLLPTGVLLWFLHEQFRRSPRFIHLVSWVGVGLTWLWLAYLGSRSRTASFAVLALAMYYIPRRRNPPLSLLVGVFLGLLIVVQFQELYRERFTHLSFNTADIDTEEAKQGTLPTFLGGDLGFQGSRLTPGNEFNCSMTVVELVPETVPFNYGYVFLEYITRFIPRSLWPEKRYPLYEAQTPIMALGGLSTVRIRDTDLLMGPAFTFVGYWYHVLGPIGLVLGGFIHGTVFRAIRAVLDRDPFSKGNMIMFTSFFYFGFGDAAATPLAWVFDLPYIVFSLALVFTFAGNRRRAFEDA